MKLEKFLIQAINEREPPKGLSQVIVPKGAIFRKAIVILEGIYGWYEIPEIETKETRIDSYLTMRPEVNTVPDGAQFVDIITTLVDVPSPRNPAITHKGTAVFPIYCIKHM